MEGGRCMHRFYFHVLVKFSVQCVGLVLHFLPSFLFSLPSLSPYPLPSPLHRTTWMRCQLPCYWLGTRWTSMRRTREKCPLRPEKPLQRWETKELACRLMSICNHNLTQGICISAGVQLSIPWRPNLIAMGEILGI